MTAVLRLPRPVPCPGARSYWPLPEDVRQAVVSQLASAPLVENKNAPLSWPPPWLPAGVSRMPALMRTPSKASPPSSFQPPEAAQTITPLKRAFQGQLPDAKRAKPAETSESKPTELWACSSCTLLNDKHRFSCKACDSLAPGYQDLERSLPQPPTIASKPHSENPWKRSLRQGPATIIVDDTPTPQAAAMDKQFASSPGTIFSVGHSNKGLDHFVSLLAPHGIKVVADVRSFPDSANEAFNIWARRNSLKEGLAAKGIAYEWHGAILGGKRQSAGDSLEERLVSPAGRQAVQQLCERARSGERIALTCAEENRCDCHRNIIADDLARAGLAVKHILPQPGAALAHHMPQKQSSISKFFSKAVK